MKQYGVRPSAHLSVCPICRPLQQRAVRLLLGAPRAGDIDRPRQQRRRNTVHSSTPVISKCEQCHVYSRRRRLNTDLFISLHRELQSI